MAGKSNIEWTGHTWNPFAGCAVLSPGCTNCYAMKMAARLDAMGQSLYKGLTKPSKAGAVWRGTVRANPDALLAPLKRKTPTTYFVNSMSDLFYEKFDDDLIDRVFAVMALCPQHTFQVLTKRAERMRVYFAEVMADHALGLNRFGIVALALGLHGPAGSLPAWPLPNVWLGVSAERQQEADERIPHLLQTPAAIRFVSAEPLLGPIDLSVLHGPNTPPVGHALIDAGSMRLIEGLDWIIVGGEGGRGARPFYLEWGDALVEQCLTADIPVFVKQLGANVVERDENGLRWTVNLRSPKGGDPEEWPARLAIRQMPKSKAMPQRVTA